MVARMEQTNSIKDATMKPRTTVNATFTLPTSFPGIVDMGGESVESLKKEYLAMIERSLEIEVTAEWRNGERIK
jgi:hypothetical protein